jgi:hypothetical protein
MAEVPRKPSVCSSGSMCKITKRKQGIQMHREFIDFTKIVALSGTSIKA